VTWIWLQKAEGNRGKRKKLIHIVFDQEAETKKRTQALTRVSLDSFARPVDKRKLKAAKKSLGRLHLPKEGAITPNATPTICGVGNRAGGDATSH